MYLRLLRARADDEGGTRKHWEAWQRRFDVVGLIDVVAGVSPEGDFVAALLFESSDAADYFSRTLVRSSEWADLTAAFDGAYIVEDFAALQALGAGNWPRAGALQVVHGTVGDGDELLRVAHLMAAPIESACPDIVSTVVATEGDRFCHLTLFTSRADAEANEGARPEVLAELTERWAALVSDLGFVAIDEPWHRVAEGPTPTDQTLTAVLVRLVERLAVPDATALFVSEGMVVARAGAVGVDPGLLASLGGDLAERAGAVTAGARRGSLRYSLASGDRGSVAVMSLDRGLTLIVTVPERARVEMVLYEMERVAADVILFGARPGGPRAEKSRPLPLG